MAISLKKPQEIDALRVSNRLVAQTLHLLKSHIKPGVTLRELDTLAESFILSHDAKPSFKGLYGFSGSICTSVNEVIIHGIPNEYTLKEGDLLGIDLGVNKNGWFGDGAITLSVGEGSAEDKALIACAKDALEYGISIIEPNMHFKMLSYEIEQFILKRGFVPLRSYCGHGIGRRPHEEPEIPNYLDSKNPKQGPKIKNGMVFCIEPMICQKNGEPKILNDKWSVVSVDGLRGSHYEHTVAVYDNKVEILTVCDD